MDVAQRLRAPGVDFMNADFGVIRSVPLSCRYQSVELLTATYRRHVFAKHAHETLALGVITEGCGSFWCRGVTHEARTGQVVLIPPGETHTGGSAGGDPLGYSMLYIPARGAQLYAAPPVLTDPALATALRVFTARVRRTDDPLSIESALAHALALLGRLSSGASRQRRHREPLAIRRVRAYIDEHCGDAIRLSDLALVADLNPEYLSRAFHGAVGLPPHAYLVQARVQKAKSLLAAGEPPATAAAAVGFVDQSHLTRHFKRHVGTTPARYQKYTRHASAPT
jgi:AraC-like DNA-binding protein/mannose-6-phosphate isomerase-like protein (cupin superfamily)